MGCLIFSIAGIFTGGIFTIYCLWTFFTDKFLFKDVHYVTIRTTSGDSYTYETADEKQALKVKVALSLAMG